MTENVTFRSDMKVDLVNHMGTDETVARAARVSTGKDRLEQGKIEGLIRYLVREGHTSTLEHCVLTFRMEVPIFVHRQLMTHRTLSKNSESGRYKELEPVFYIPSKDRPLVNIGSGAHPNLTHKPELYEDVRVAHENLAWKAWSEYRALVESGVATEVARNVLPVSIYTSLWMTGNLLAWFNFLKLRDGKQGHPQHEVQEVAKKVASITQEHYPLSYAAFESSRKVPHSTD